MLATPQFPITIVSAYYTLKESKYSIGKYRKWMRNFLCNIQMPLVIFTDCKSVGYILKLRRNYLKKTYVIVKDFTLLREYSRFNTWKEQYKLDSEQCYHNPSLYVIWNEKMHFMKQVSDSNPYNSEWFIWMDMGAFRKERKNKDLTSGEIQRWPVEEKVKKLPKEKLTLVKTGSAFHPKDYTVDSEGIITAPLPQHHMGGIFTLHASLIKKIHGLYYDLLAKYLDRKLFCGSDQRILANFLITYPELTHYLTPPEKSFPWFYLHHYLSDRN